MQSTKAPWTFSKAKPLRMQRAVPSTAADQISLEISFTLSLQTP